jgi:hypothetical protein
MKWTLGMSFSEAHGMIRCDRTNRDNLFAVLQVLTWRCMNAYCGHVWHSIPELMSVQSCHCGDPWPVLLGEKVPPFRSKKRYLDVIKNWMYGWRGVPPERVGKIRSFIVARPGDISPLATTYSAMTCYAVQELRELFGHPELAPPLCQQVTTAMIGLARDYRYGILADAAEDAGYSTPLILDNLRSQRPGIWAALCVLNRHPYQK